MPGKVMVRLRSYVHDLQVLMGLGLRHIEVVCEEPEECGPPDANTVPVMTITNSYVALESRIHVADRFFSRTASEQRLAVVHELLHTVQVPLSRLIESIESSGAFGTREYGLFNTMVEYANEEVTDHIARILAPFLPLPDLGDEKENTSHD